MRCGSGAIPPGQDPSGPLTEARAVRKGRGVRALLAAAATAIVVMPAAVASAGVFSFARTDYLLNESRLGGLGSVAVGDLDGKNGPDIVSENYAYGGGVGTVNVLLNTGDGTFAPAEQYDTCDGANGIVIGQFNPATDSHLDVAMVCGSGQIGRMLGDGAGHLGAVQTVDVSYLSGASPAASIGSCGPGR